jgi:hypothetical protein
MRPHYRHIMAQLRAIGATRVRVRHHGTKHPRVIFEFEGMTHFVVVPGTPSDHRGTASQVSALRRRL